MPSTTHEDTLSIAIIGGGISGLAADIALTKLPNITVFIFERHPELTEAGAGISIGYNSWKVLGLLGAADGVKGASTVSTLVR
jgi:salicylate hydroxylase